MRLFITITLLFTGFSSIASQEAFEDGDRPSSNGNGGSNGNNGRRVGKLGNASQGGDKQAVEQGGGNGNSKASAADCAKYMDIQLYSDSSTVNFRPDMKACRSGKTYVGSSDDGKTHVTLVPSNSIDKANSNAFFASVTNDVTGAVHSIGPDANGDMIVTERMQEDYGPELDPVDEFDEDEEEPRALLDDRLAKSHTSDLRVEAASASATNQLKSLGDNFLTENADNDRDDSSHGDRALQSTAIIDVLVLWTSNAECRNSGRNRGCSRTSTTENNIRGLINLAVQETNVAYDQSGVFAELQLVHASHTAYVEDSSNAFSNGLSDLRDMNEAIVKREQFGADVVALIIDDSAYCGIAWLGPSKNSMFSVTSWSCATGYYSFGHEIGHNLVS